MVDFRSCLQQPFLDCHKHWRMYKKKKDVCPAYAGAVHVHASTLLCAYANARAVTILAASNSYGCARVDVVVKTSVLGVNFIEIKNLIG